MRFLSILVLCFFAQGSDTNKTSLNTCELQFNGKNNQFVSLRPTLKYAEVVSFLESQNPEDRKYFRFFILGGDGLLRDKMHEHYLALVKMLNSLSWNADLVSPTEVGKDRTVFAIDMRLLNNNSLGQVHWTPKNWNDSLGKYPYRPRQKEVVQWGDSQPISRAYRRIQDLSEAEVPVVRVDWFVAVFSVPPFYNKFLGLKRGPKQFERFLLDLKAKFDGEQAGHLNRVARIGVLESGPSPVNDNRIIQRYPIGAYTGSDGQEPGFWSTFDFDSSNAQGETDIVMAPISSRGAGDPHWNAPVEFKHNGGEHIFTLPNGLLAFAIVKSDNNSFVEFAPTSLVVDMTRTATQTYLLSKNQSSLSQGDSAVINGFSCMGCHRSGLIEVRDELIQYFDINNTLQKYQFPGERRKVENYVKRIYDDDKVSNSFIQDNARYHQALANIGIKRPASDPVSAVVRRYNQPLSLSELALEFYLQPRTLRKRIQRAYGNRIDDSLYYFNAARGRPNIERSDIQDNFENWLFELYNLRK